jgi:hypothetical protein
VAKSKKFYETDDFKTLQKEWYGKLDPKEFDLEEGLPDNVIRPEVIRTEKSQYDGGTAYWNLCQEILRTYRFKKDVHKTIFELHTNGLSERQIATEIKKKTLTKMSQKGINLLINRVKESYLKGE